MRSTLTLIRKEFSSYFVSPVAYVVMAVFLLVTGFLFTRAMEQLTADGPQGVEFPMQMMLGLGDMRSLPGVLSFLLFWSIFLVIPPLLTMRLLAEERATGNLEMLLTTPMRDWQIVFCKFIACFLFYIVLWLPTLVYVPVLTDFDWAVLAGGFLSIDWSDLAASWNNFDWDIFVSGIDSRPVLTTYIGLALAGAMLLSVGMFITSLVKSPLLAVFISLIVSMCFFLAGFWRPDLELGSDRYQLVFFFTVPLHFERNFTRGLVDTRQLVLYASVALFCLFLTVRSLESRRWR